MCSRLLLLLVHAEVLGIFQDYFLLPDNSPECRRCYAQLFCQESALFLRVFLRISIFSLKERAFRFLDILNTPVFWHVASLGSRKTLKDDTNTEVGAAKLAFTRAPTPRENGIAIKKRSKKEQK